MCRSRPWPKPPSTPTGRWQSHCTAAISAKASPASWKSGRRGLRGNSSEKEWWLLQPVVALRAMPGTLRPFGTCMAAPRVARRAKRGGARRDRTADLVIANDALSQLSYGPIATAESERRRPTIGAIYNPRQGQVKNGENRRFTRDLPGLPLFARRGTD